MRARDTRFFTELGEQFAVHSTLKRSLEIASARKQKLHKDETIKDS
jgi:hypothetical protein